MNRAKCDNMRSRQALGDRLTEEEKSFMQNQCGK